MPFLSAECHNRLLLICLIYLRRKVKTNLDFAKPNLAKNMKFSIIKSKKKVLLTVECRDMKKPKVQRSNFDQTLGSNSWMLQENRKPELHEDGTVTTVSVWGRTFSDRKSEDKIKQITYNLLNRASEFAGIEDYNATYEFTKVSSDLEAFSLAPVLFQDD